MPSLLRRARTSYGANPLQLLVLVAAFALTGYVVLVLTPEGLVGGSTWWQSIAVWFLGAFLLHDLLLFPLYALADRSLHAGLRAVRGTRRRTPGVVPVLNHVRLPALASGLTLLMFFPGIIAQGADTYLTATGLTQDPFLTRWLLLVAAFFGVSAIAYAVRLGLAHRAAPSPAPTLRGADRTGAHAAGTPQP